jgi:hypothetical protein
MSFAQAVFKFFAARFHIPGDALNYFFASRHLAQPAETLLPFPAELIPIGARLVLRGWLNNKFFPSNRDWILPYWAERQFDPRDPGFMPRGFNLYTINYTRRDWTMIGNLDHAREAIVDPRGWVTPWFDGWSLDVWIECDGKLIAPSRVREDELEQSLYENLPIVITTFCAGDLRVRLEAFVNENNFVIENITIKNPARLTSHASLYLALRPFNPEGVSLIRDIEFRDHAFIVNHALGAMITPPDAIACSNFANGDVAFARANNQSRAHCAAGLATAIAVYHFDLAPNESKSFTAQMPMVRVEIDDNQSPISNLQSPSEARAQAITHWRAKLAQGMTIRVPDEKLQNAFDANKAFLLLLHDGDSITPGPFTYHQFWFRDAAYMLNALDKLGYHDEARAVIEKFPRRLEKDGYLRATEGEWDSNGAALWTMVEHARLSGAWDVISQNYWSLLRMASWINSKRRTMKNGLLPPGPSAEHLGPSDYFYWDDFWGLAGLRDAAFVAERLEQTNDAQKLRANFEAFRATVDASLNQVATRIGRAAMPASPNRRLDAAMIGNLVALYPLRVFDARDPRIADTLIALKEIAWLEDAYFNDVGHSAFGTYLSLHAAQCYLFQRDPQAWKIIAWVLQHASPTFTWAEGIHPITRRGGMGDGHHGWALADILLAVRNALLFEENAHLVITPALPEHWTTEMNVIKVEHAPTYFGNVSYTIAFGERTATLVIKGDWREQPAFIEWNLPFALRECGGDGDVEISGNAVRLARGVTRAVAMW